MLSALRLRRVPVSAFLPTRATVLFRWHAPLQCYKSTKFKADGEGPSICQAGSAGNHDWAAIKWPHTAQSVLVRHPFAKEKRARKLHRAKKLPRRVGARRRPSHTTIQAQQPPWQLSYARGWAGPQPRG